MKNVQNSPDRDKKATEAQEGAERKEKPQRRTKLEEIKEGQNEDVFALVKSYDPPKKTAGTDYSMNIYLTDESLKQGVCVMVQMFFRTLEEFPKNLYEMQTIMKIPAVTYKTEKKGRKNLLLDRRYGYFLFSIGTDGVSYVPYGSYLGMQYASSLNDREAIKSIVEAFTEKISLGPLPFGSLCKNTTFTAFGYVDRIVTTHRSSIIYLEDMTDKVLKLQVWDRKAELLPKQGNWVRIGVLIAKEIRDWVVTAVVSRTTTFSWREEAGTEIEELLRVLSKNRRERLANKILVHSVRNMESKQAQEEEENRAMIRKSVRTTLSTLGPDDEKARERKRYVQDTIYNMWITKKVEESRKRAAAQRASYRIVDTKTIESLRGRGATGSDSKRVKVDAESITEKTQAAGAKEEAPEKKQQQNTPPAPPKEPIAKEPPKRKPVTKKVTLSQPAEKQEKKELPSKSATENNGNAPIARKKPENTQQKPEIAANAASAVPTTPNRPNGNGLAVTTTNSKPTPATYPSVIETHVATADTPKDLTTGSLDLPNKEKSARTADQPGPPLQTQDDLVDFDISYSQPAIPEDAKGISLPALSSPIFRPFSDSAPPNPLPTTLSQVVSGGCCVVDLEAHPELEEEISRLPRKKLYEVFDKTNDKRHAYFDLQTIYRTPTAHLPSITAREVAYYGGIPVVFEHLEACTTKTLIFLKDATSTIYIISPLPK